jgi:hypothetical protein
MKIGSRLSDLYLENYIESEVQSPAVEININPYQGLKLNGIGIKSASVDGLLKSTLIPIRD